jgi:hypothetical protein
MLQLQQQLQDEHLEKSSKSFTKHSFAHKTNGNGVTASKTSITVNELLAGKLKNHQCNHYEGPIGKIVDFLSFMDVLHPNLQKDFAKAWLEKAEALGLKQISGFAKLIVLCPGVTRDLLSFMRGVFFCEWTRQIEGQQGRVFAYERCLPSFKEVVMNSFSQTESEIKNSEASGQHIAIKEGSHSYFLSLPGTGSPVQIVRDLLDALPRLQTTAQQYAPGEGLGILQEAFKCLNFNSGYLSKDAGSFIEKQLLTAFDAPHVKKVCESLFKEHEDAKQVLSLLGLGLKDSPDREMHMQKMARACIERCREYGNQLRVPELRQCCSLILKYTDTESAKPLAADLELLTLLPGQILSNANLNAVGIQAFFKSNYAYVLPHIIRSLLVVPDSSILKHVERLYESAIRIELFTPQQEEALLMEFLKARDQLVPASERSKSEWDLRLSVNALEKGILNDSRGFLHELRRLIASDNPRFLLYVHRYLGTLLTRKDYDRGEKLSLLKDLLQASLKFNLPQLDKMCFDALIKLNQIDVELFNKFNAEHGVNLLGDFIQAAERLHHNRELDRNIFTGLGLIIHASAHCPDLAQLAYGFKLQLQLKPSDITLEEMECCAQTASLLLRKGQLIDRITMTDWLDFLVLRLLAAFKDKNKAVHFKNVGKELLADLLSADPRPECQIIVKQRLLLRMASAVSKQRAILHAQDKLETLGKIYIELSDKWKWSSALAVNNLKSLLDSEFKEEQSRRVGAFLSVVRELDATLITHAQLIQLEEQSGKDEADRKSSPKQKEITSEDIVHASEELVAIAASSKEFRIARTNNICRFVMDTLQTLAARSSAFGKEESEQINKSLYQAITTLAASSNLSAVRQANLLYEQTAALHFWDEGKQGKILIELLKGHVTVEKLNPEMDFFKDLKKFAIAIHKSVPFTDQALGFEGRDALLTVSERLQKGTEEEFSEAAKLLLALNKHPTTNPGLARRIVQFSSRFITRCLEQNRKETCCLALNFFADLAKSRVFDSTTIDLIERVILKLSQNPLIMSRKDESCDKELSEFLSAAKEHLFQQLSLPVKISLLKALTYTGRKHIRDWCLKLMPGSDKSEAELAKAYESFMQYLFKMGEKEDDLAVLISAANLLKDYYQPGLKILKPSGKQALAHICYISIQARLQNKDRLKIACTTLMKEAIGNVTQPVCAILKGYATLPYSQYDAEILKILNEITAFTKKNIPFLNQENLDMITRGFFELYDVILSVKKDQSLFQQITQSYIGYLEELKKHNKTICDGKKICKQLFQIPRHTDSAFSWDKGILEMVNKLIQLFATDDLVDIYDELNNFLQINHQEIMKFELTISHKDSVANPVLLYTQIHELADRIFLLFPFYELFDKELGRQALERFINLYFNTAVVENTDYIFKCLSIFDEHKFFEIIKTKQSDASAKFDAEMAVKKSALEERYLRVLSIAMTNIVGRLQLYKLEVENVHQLGQRFANLIYKGKHFSFIDQLFQFYSTLALFYYGKALISGDWTLVKNFINDIYNQVEIQIREKNRTVYKGLLQRCYGILTSFALDQFLLKACAEADKKLLGASTHSLGSKVYYGRMEILLGSAIKSNPKLFSMVNLNIPMITLQAKLLFNLFSTPEEFDRGMSDPSVKMSSELLSDCFDKYFISEIAAASVDPDQMKKLSNILHCVYENLLPKDDFTRFQKKLNIIFDKNVALLRKKVGDKKVKKLERKKPETASESASVSASASATVPKSKGRNKNRKH